MAPSHQLSGWLSTPSHEAKSTRDRLRTSDSSGQTDPGKSRDRPVFFFFFQREESGKLAKCQLRQITLMSAVLDTKISSELNNHGNGCTFKHAQHWDTRRWRPLKSRISVSNKLVRWKVINKSIGKQSADYFHCVSGFSGVKSNSSQ